MTQPSGPHDTDARPLVDAPAPSLRVVNEGLGAGVTAGIVGAVLGLVFTWLWPDMPLSGPGAATVKLGTWLEF